jgi:class 3 adenylate cyclase
LRIGILDRIGTKLALLMLAGTSLVFSALLIYSDIYSRQIILRDGEKRARHLTLSVARRIEQEFRSVAKVTQTLASMIETAPLDKDRLLTMLERAVKDNKEVFGSAAAFEPYEFENGLRSFGPYYFRKDGGIEFIQLGNDSYDYFTKDWYHIPKIMRSPVWSEPYYDDGGGRTLMTTYSVPFFDSATEEKEKKLRGIVTADISLVWLTKLLADVETLKYSYFFIISEVGTFVTHINPDYIMRESIFSLAEELNDNDLRQTGRAMLRKGSGLVHIGPALTGEEAILAHAKIPSPGWALGAVFSKRELEQEMVALNRAMIGLASIGVVLLLIPSVLISRSISKPLRQMADASHRVENGNLDIDLSNINSHDEVGQLAKSLTDMSRGLREREFIRDTFGRYLTKEVVKRILESQDGLRLGGESREISMIMSDLRGFTALTSTMQPEDVIKFLNRYLSNMVDILIELRGTIDEIIGDGILAFFGAPEPEEDHPARAVACALKMQNAMDEINRRNEDEGLPHLEMGVAVNTGSVVVGNIGSEKRSKYGVVGSQVNITGRIESFTTGGQVLISQSTYDRLQDLLEIRNVLEVEVKGIHGKVNLYDVSGIAGDFNEKLHEKNYSLVKLSSPVAVEIYSMKEKIVGSACRSGVITAISPTSATISTKDPMAQWEDLRFEIAKSDHRSVHGDAYAKVVSVEKSEDLFIASLRFTSVSPEVYKSFRKLFES